MPKPPRRPARAQAPDPAQIAAVRRAAHAGQRAQARQRLAALRAAFPGHKPLLGLAWEIEDGGDDPMRAAARAYDWHRASPGSRAALEALHDSADRAGLTALQISAHRALQALAGTGTSRPLPLFIKTDDSLSHEQAEALDLGRMHLHDDNPQATVAVLRDLQHPAARNNLAVALFMIGDVAAARQVAEANWQSGQSGQAGQGGPANLFALERMLRWRCWTEGMDRCAGFAATLRQAMPDRADHAMARVAALRFLGQADAAHQAWRDTAQAPYWEPGDPRRGMFDALGDPAAEWPGGPLQWFPSTWLEGLRTLATQAQQLKSPAAAQAAMDARFDAHFGTCDAHVDYLDRAVTLGDAPTREMAREVLMQRARHGDAAALAALQASLKYPAGPDTERGAVLAWLLEHGLIQPRSTVEIWQKGGLRRISPGRTKVHSAQGPSPFPPEGDALNRRVIEAIHRGALHDALDLAQRLQRLYPQQPMPLTHLAAIKEALRHPDAEVTDLYRQAHALDPSYLFARCGLAGRLAAQGQTEEARALIDGLLEQRQEMHFSEFRSLTQAQRALAVADGDLKAIQAADEALAALERQFSR
ncbi:MAG TPA: hypothetical protein VFL86_02160 [Burkholderiaceae bacterium]|nr:hypothetical protein [Burkholderiaceae bacterium]